MVCKNAVSKMIKGIPIKNSLPMNFKALQRETSVHKYYIELKDGLITEQGFLDLVKVPSLRVLGAGRLVRKLRSQNKLRQKDAAKILNTSLSQVWDWERSKTTIPLQLLVTLSEICGLSKETIYSMIDKGEISLKGKINLPVRFEKIRDIVQYLNPHKVGTQGQITLLKCPYEARSKIKERLNIKSRSYELYRPIIYSRGLYNYLKTFFRYTRNQKIQFPLTKKVKLWYDEGIDLKRSVICPCLQSDGFIKRSKSHEYKIRFYGCCRALHDYFVDALYYEYNILPTSYYAPTSTKVHYTAYTQKKVSEIAYELINLSGNTKTSPAPRQTIDEYLMEPQPHLNYLNNATLQEQKIAFRIWMSTEGSISVIKHKKRGSGRRLRIGYVRPRIVLSCAHPVLVKQLKYIAKQLHIPLYISRSKKCWSGISALSNETISACIELLKHGGFIENVKISAHSSYHEGIDKNVLLLGILEFKKREQKNSNLKNLPIQQVHHKINKIIENSEYKSADLYIDYFS